MLLFVYVAYQYIILDIYENFLKIISRGVLSWRNRKKTEIKLPFMKGVPRHFDKHRFPTAVDHVHYHVLWFYSDPVESHHQRGYAAGINHPLLVRDARDHDHIFQCRF